MSIIVQKYGGSSVATPNQIKEVAQRVVATHQKGHNVVVVVSAMGNTTNQLLSLAHQVSDQPQHRELDMLVTVGERISMSLLSMAIQDLGYPAVSFTGSQSGIITTHNHSNARIIAVKPYRLQQALAQNKIVIVAGFQGVSEKLEITSLGRGGSDTTAVALAAALGAEYAEICSDVDGVYSTDPRLCTDAQKLTTLDYESMQVLADSGAKVLNAEAVEWAKRSGITIHCVATQDVHAQGTRIQQDHSADVVEDVSEISAKDVTKKSRQHPIHLHAQVSAITHHPGLYYLCHQVDASQNVRPAYASDSKPSSMNPQESLSEILMILDQWNLVDIDLHTSHLGWQMWVATQNIHQPQALQQAIQDKIECNFDTLYTYVTIVGRGLLSTTTDQSNIYQQAQELIHTHHYNIIAQELKPSHLRWTLPLSEGKSLVQRLHQHIIENSSSKVTD